MCKSVCFLVAPFLFGFPLSADPIQNLTITSLTASAVGGGPLVSFTATGPSVSIGGTQGTANPPGPELIGFPIGTVTFPLPPGVFGTPIRMLGGVVTTDDTQTFVQLSGSAQVSGTTDLLVPNTNTTLSFPGLVTGAYSAFACGMFEAPPNCTGPQIANISIDLPGILTLTYSSNLLPLGDNQLQSIGFTSVPEPSTIWLAWLGLGAFVTKLYRAGASFRSRRRSALCKSASRRRGGAVPGGPVALYVDGRR